MIVSLIVAVAENGKEGLARVADHKPALIITDLMMPVMDGFDFVDQLRRQEDYRDIPVIVLTAKDLTEDDRRRLSGQVERIFDKGSQDPDGLVQRLRQLVDSAEAVEQ